MSQRVPSWDVDNINHSAARASLRSNSNSTAPDVPMLDYEVAELTWQNGQLSMNGLGLPRAPAKPITATTVAAARNTSFTPSASQSKYIWEKLPRTSGTLESIVNQATRLPHSSKSMSDGVGVGDGDGYELVPWFDPRRAAAVAATTASNTMTMDALVPCSNRTDEQSAGGAESVAKGIGTCVAGCSASGAAAEDGDKLLGARLGGVASVPVAREWSSRDQSMSGRDSHHVTLDTCDRELDAGYASTSMGSPENTSSAGQWTKTAAAAADDHDSVCHSTQREEGDEDDRMKRTLKSSESNKRSRAAAVHNQSERKRRDKINQRMKTLQKLVPNSSKTDKASILDEVIEYVKQLQAQLQMMSRMSMSSMMLPMTMQQQLQMSMMAPMGMGLGMDMNTMARPNIPTIPPILHPTAAFMPMAAAWDASGGGNRLQGAPATRVMPDPLSTFLACQSQPMTMDAYSKIVAMYQQLQQAPASSSQS